MSHRKTVKHADVIFTNSNYAHHQCFVPRFRKVFLKGMMVSDEAKAKNRWWQILFTFFILCYKLVLHEMVMMMTMTMMMVMMMMMMKKWWQILSNFYFVTKSVATKYGLATFKWLRSVFWLWDKYQTHFQNTRSGVPKDEDCTLKLDCDHFD